MVRLVPERPEPEIFWSSVSVRRYPLLATNASTAASSNWVSVSTSTAQAQTVPFHLAISFRLQLRERSSSVLSR